MKKCFLICPIGDENSDTRTRSDKLANHLLSPICEKCGYELIRADKIKMNDKIDETIINEINDADLVICDITELNPNVFYELGYSVAIGKQVIQISDNSIEKIPFDRITARTFQYSFDISDAATFNSDIIDVIKNIEESAEIKNSISNNESDENTFGKSFSAIQSYLERLDTSYRSIEEKVIQNNHFISRIEKELTSKDNQSNIINDEKQQKLLELLFQHPQSLNALVNLMIASEKKDSENTDATIA